MCLSGLCQGFLDRRVFSLCDSDRLQLLTFRHSCDSPAKVLLDQDINGRYTFWEENRPPWIHYEIHVCFLSRSVGVSTAAKEPGNIAKAG